MFVSGKAAGREPFVAVHQFSQCRIGGETALRCRLRREYEFQAARQQANYRPRYAHIQESPSGRRQV
jgi:hypothetical protein